MDAMGRLGSYITQGVYSVSGPFHPFGGAVDIVVVEQQDGTFKSSPWYVRFGKFQGVLKSQERIVNVSVNGVEVNFHMVLDQRGEAYFLREVDLHGEETVLSPSSSGEETDVSHRPIKSKSLNYGFDKYNSVSRTNSRRTRILGFVLGKKSMKEESLKEDNGVVRADSLERAELAADLLELKWSTNLASRRNKRNDTPYFSSPDVSNEKEEKESLLIDDGKAEVNSVLHQLTENGLKFSEPNEDRAINGNYDSSIKILSEVNNTDLVSEVHEGSGGVVKNTVPSTGLGVKDSSARFKIWMENNETDMVSDGHKEGGEVFNNAMLSTAIEVADFSTLEAIPGEKMKEDDYYEGNCGDSGKSALKEVNICHSKDEVNYWPEFGLLAAERPLSTGVALEHSRCENFIVGGHNLESKLISPKTNGIVAETDLENYLEEQLFFGDLDDVKLGEFSPTVDYEVEKCQECSVTSEVHEAGNESSNFESDSCYAQFYHEGTAIDVKGLSKMSNDSARSFDTPRTYEVMRMEVRRLAKSLPNMRYLDYSQVSKSKSSKWNMLRQNVLSIMKSNKEKQHSLSVSQKEIEGATNSEGLKDESERLAIDLAGDPSRIADASSGSWRLWPFPVKRPKSMKVSQPALDTKDPSDPIALEDPSLINGEKEMSKSMEKKKKIRVNNPTSEQLASLNLQEGRNIVTFTFSTSVLGPQQVDARIYLWRWDTHIVISDVDGTITKSDVLGQFMPLVGRDWSQTGVAHLYSAIKENGYQLLFLSARAISQAYHTRQFLFNLKQDGKVLPDGPVVISPDGLFPSLFREVIRRAPHEFKIACLEDIRALFPPDRNPFYAGFGNRDTDEFSYLKVGIPKGKIFIINPKGEIVVNRTVNSKSYTSLRTLVNNMFPAVSSHEQEDYNTWNFWKLPLPALDI